MIFCGIYYLVSNFSQNPANLGGSRKKAMFEEAKFLVSLLAKVAKSDGRVNELEARLISETLDDITLRLGNDAAMRAELKQIYNREKETVHNAYFIARQYKDRFHLSQDAAAAKISFLLNLAYIDGEFSKSERNIIEQIASGFGLDEGIFEAILARFEAFYDQRQTRRNPYEMRTKSPYAVLGLKEDAPFDEVKKCYRELVKKYHPDILMGRGESEEMIERSTRKLQEINEAYEEIRGRGANN